METVLYIIFFVSCLVLVIAVLLQPGKTDAGALFTSGISSAALNPRGTQSVLSKLTIGAATVFMISALLLSLPALTGNRSVLDTQPVEDGKTAGADTNSNANVGNTNASAASNTNSGAVNKEKENTGSESNKANPSTESEGKDTGAKPAKP